MLAAQDAARVVSEAFWPTTGMAIAIIVLAWGVMRLSVWLHEAESPEDQFQQMLTQYQEMHARGELTTEELRSIKSRVIAQTHVAERSPAVKKSAPRTADALQAPENVDPVPADRSPADSIAAAAQMGPADRIFSQAVTDSTNAEPTPANVVEEASPQKI